MLLFLSAADTADVSFPGRAPVADGVQLGGARLQSEDLVPAGGGVRLSHAAGGAGLQPGRESESWLTLRVLS